MGIDAVLAFPWPILGLAFWCGTLLWPKLHLQFAIAGTAAGACLILTGVLAKGYVCAACLAHFLVLLSSLLLTRGVKNRVVNL